MVYFGTLNIKKKLKTRHGPEDVEFELMWTGNKTSPTRKNTPPSNYTRKKWNVSEGACFGLPI